MKNGTFQNIYNRYYANVDDFDFDNEIQSENWPENAGRYPVARVYDSRNRFLGTGLYSPISRIRFRLLSRDEIAPDKDFFRGKIRRAIAYRREMGFDGACRLIFGESDGLPGLIVDRFAEVLSVQFLCFGIDFFKDMICDILVEELHPKAVVERSDADIRKKEGLELQKKVMYGTLTAPVTIMEDDLVLEADALEGQKTGYFLDQKRNHRLARRFASGAKVLDLFSHTGGFGLHAAKAGAESVSCVDTSADALAAAARNAQQNGLSSRMEFIETNVFDLLRNEQENKRLYDLVILDPPAFAKSRAHVDKALGGYKDINYRAMSIVRDGGWLISCSCSFAVSSELFEDMLVAAAADAGRSVRLFDRTGADFDHPSRLGYAESSYLKCFWMQVLSR